MITDSPDANPGNFFYEWSKKSLCFLGRTAKENPASKSPRFVCLLFPSKQYSTSYIFCAGLLEVEVRHQKIIFSDEIKKRALMYPITIGLAKQLNVESHA